MNYRRIFLDGYSYYLTLVTQGRKPILIENIELLRDAFRRSIERYSYRIDAIVILPDHLHMIITPKNANDYPKIIRAIKRSFVYGIDAQFKEQAKTEISHKKYERSHAGIWQERYFEHTIRDEKDYLNIISYIQHNPTKHGLTDDATTWKYSSFNKDQKP